MASMEGCIFCKIISGSIPSTKVYEDDRVLAFLDIRPLNHGHTLVVPKKHYRNMLDTPEDEWLELMKITHRIAPAIMKAVGADGINIQTNNEKAAGQDVFHAHVHIIPRIEGDPYQPWVGFPYKDGEAQQVAEKIRSKL